jgi:hypothetical protein
LLPVQDETGVACPHDSSLRAASAVWNPQSA